MIFWCEGNIMAGTFKILVVEDERPMARALELKLTNSGFTVSLASDGEEAINKIEHEKFNVILLDLILPKVDGFVVLEALKKKGIKIPVIVTSNLGQDEDKARAKELGAQGYFVKSNTSISQLVEEVKKVVV